MKNESKMIRDLRKANELAEKLAALMRCALSNSGKSQKAA